MIYITTENGVTYQYCPERKSLDIAQRLNNDLSVVYLNTNDLIKLKELFTRMEL